MNSHNDDRRYRRKRRNAENVVIKNRSRSRSGALIFVVLALIAIVVIGRLIYLQLIMHDEYSHAAEELRTSNIILQAKRGTIYDRNGSVLAKSVEAKTVYCNATEVEKPLETAAVLAEVLGGDVQDYMDALTSNKTFRYIKKKIDVSKADELKKHKLKGIYFLPDSRRVYPSGGAAGQVIGLVDVDGNGLSGLELYYNDILKGKDGELVIERGRTGTPINESLRKVKDPKNGTDIVVSIDLDLQMSVEKIAEHAQEEFDTKTAEITVMEPETGEILAMCSTPLMDLTDRTTANADSMRLKPITDSLEPGSTFKIPVVASALDAGSTEVDKEYELPTTIQVGDHRVSDATERGAVRYSTDEIITHSSNVGMVKIARELGGEKLYSYLQKFGFGQNTNIDFPGEQSGILKDIEHWDGSSLGSMAFGQGVAVTPIQLTKAVGAIANEGLIVQPHFLVSKDGEYVEYPKAKRIVKTAVAKETTQMMIHVVESGTAQKAAIEGFDIAGKTGTAQHAEAGGYVKGLYNVSLVGFVPAADPEFVACVVLKGSGSSAASNQTFKKVCESGIDILNIRPNDDEANED